MATEVSLLSFSGSPYGTRVKIALELKGIKHEFLGEENLLEKKSQLLVESNPVHKKVPVLFHKGRSISESLVILQYLDAVWKDRYPLVPTDPYLQAQAMFWADFVNQKLYSSGRKICVTEGKEQEKGKMEFIKCLKLLEKQLGEKPYFGDGKIGFLDVVIIGHYSWFYSYQKFGNFSIEAECPKLMRWAKRCIEIESVAKSLPEEQKVYEFVVAMKKKIMELKSMNQRIINRL